MVAIEHTAGILASAYRNPQRRTVGLLAGVTLALVLSLAGFVLHGGGLNGAHFAGNLVLFSASLVFVAYYVAGPVSRLILAPATHALGATQYSIAYGFAGMIAVFLVTVLAPDFTAGATVPLPTAAYAIFTALVTVVFVMSAGSKLSSRSAAMRTLQSVSSGFFWLVFAFTDLDRMVGPHRPDSIPYGLSLLLLAVALLVRFADALFARHRAGMSGDSA